MPEYFNDLFDQWASSYDDTVVGKDVEYREVFRRYDEILETIAERANGFVLEFGVGTGNLTKKLVTKGMEVIGIEPSENMRKIAKQKLPGTAIVKGSFLSFPALGKKVDTIVSSYAFHHLTDAEKEQAIQLYTEMLHEGGKIIFGDTIFENDEAKQLAYLDAKNKKYDRLANDLNTEFYTTIPKLTGILEKHGFTVRFERMNDFVWIMEADFKAAK